jgi:hypothetical protein
LGRRARFGIQRDIATFFDRRKNGGQFHRYSSVYKEADCRALSGLLPNPLPGYNVRPLLRLTYSVQLINLSR